MTESVAHGLEILGVGVVAAGGITAAWAFGRRVIAGDAFDGGSDALRTRLARATLLGLEFLVAADIIGTVAALPTPTSLLMLTGVILLRTFLSATLTLEIEGRWPWTLARRQPRTVRSLSHRQDPSVIRLPMPDIQRK